MRHDPATQLVYCLVSQAELDAIAAASWLALPGHEAEPLVLYSAQDEEYILQQAAHRLAAADEAGYIVRFALDADYAAQFPVHSGPQPQQDELWIPAQELTELNSQIVGAIEVMSLVKLS